MAKKGRPKLWKNCSEEEQSAIYEIEQSYVQLREELEKRNINKKQYRSKVARLLKKVDELEVKYQ